MDNFNLRAFFCVLCGARKEGVYVIRWEGVDGGWINNELVFIDNLLYKNNFLVERLVFIDLLGDFFVRINHR